MIYYIYDASGNVIGMKYNDNIYYYEKNIQNDITGIMDDSFNLLATYEYDSWGNILSIKDTNGNTITDSTNIALVNPFRYRSYYYDSEIGMYYLNSRYYNQGWGRFINADGYLSTSVGILTHNAYSYANNNVINMTDSDGTIPIPLIIFGVGFVAGVAGQLVADIVTSVYSWDFKISSWQTYVGSAIGGGVGAFGLITGGPVMFGALSGFSSSVVTQGLNKITVDKDLTFSKFIRNVGIDTTLGGLAGYVDIKLPSITSGRNSASAIFNSGLKKLANSTAKNMSTRVITKGIISQITSNLFSSTTNGYRNYINNWVDGLISPIKYSNGSSLANACSYRR